MRPFAFVTQPLALFALLSSIGYAQYPTITTYVGPTVPAIGARANTQSIGVPQAVAADGAGGFYVTSSSHNRRSARRSQQMHYACGISWRTCSGSSPSHSGVVAVPSKSDVVLNGSNFPVAAAAAVFARSGCSSASLIGWNVRTASNA